MSTMKPKQPSKAELQESLPGCCRLDVPQARRAFRTPLTKDTMTTYPIAGITCAPISFGMLAGQLAAHVWIGLPGKGASHAAAGPLEGHQRCPAAGQKRAAAAPAVGLAGAALPLRSGPWRS